MTHHRLPPINYPLPFMMRCGRILRLLTLRHLLSVSIFQPTGCVQARSYCNSLALGLAISRSDRTTARTYSSLPVRWYVALGPRTVASTLPISGEYFRTVANGLPEPPMVTNSPSALVPASVPTKSIVY